MSAKQYKSNVVATGLSAVIAAVLAVLFWTGAGPFGNGLSYRARIIVAAVMTLDSIAMVALTVYRYLKLQQQFREQGEDRQ